ncbi:hypothetical protein ACERII_21770 [Evansella sp. AB-rgal1]|uniref:hypothetical protein n=1 Tax=Evansella sp. AB-rgal1 TaxID=3242696 RepID=UPI00359D6FAA
MWDDFNWRNSTTLTKSGKALGIFGTGMIVYDNARQHGIKSSEFVVDTVIDVGSAAGSMAAGAAVGSLFLPPAGTVVGAGVGLGINALANVEFGPPLNNSVIGFTKDIANKAVDGIASGVSSVTNSIGNNLKKIFW